MRLILVVQRYGGIVAPGYSGVLYILGTWKFQRSVCQYLPPRCHSSASVVHSMLYRHAPRCLAESSLAIIDPIGLWNYCWPHLQICHNIYSIYPFSHFHILTRTRRSSCLPDPPVDPHKESGQNLYRQYAGKKKQSKIVLNAQWVHQCIQDKALHGFATGWAGYKVTGNEPCVVLSYACA